MGLEKGIYCTCDTKVVRSAGSWVGQKLQG